MKPTKANSRDLPSLVRTTLASETCDALGMPSDAHLKQFGASCCGSILLLDKQMFLMVERTLSLKSFLPSVLELIFVIHFVLVVRYGSNNRAIADQRREGEKTFKTIA